MSAFEDFIKIELPLRQVLIKDAGDPTVVGVPAVRGTYYLDTSNNYTRYEKTGGGNTDWTPVGGSDGGIKHETNLSTDANNLSATVVACFDTTQIKTVKYVIHIENNNSFCAYELLVSYHNTIAQGEGVKHVAYAAVGQSDLASIETEKVGDVVYVKLVPTEVDLIVYCTGIVVSPGSSVGIDCN